MTGSKAYDGIVVGTGHNALILQAYLCRAGLKVLSIDRADRCGGGLATIPNPRVAGAWHNPHSFFHRAITVMPWYRDLDLEKHGARYIEPELNVIMLLRDGRSLQWWTDLERTAESFAEFSAGDAAALRRWAEVFEPILQEILLPEAQSPPLLPEERDALLRSTKLGRILLEVEALSPLEFVTREFKHDVIRAGLLFFNGLREVDLRLRGFGHVIPALLASQHKAQMCIGGSARLADALAEEILEHGGEIRTRVPLRRIVVENGRAAGVETAAGERLVASGFVASGLNPQQTFLEYIDPENVPAELRDRARGFQYNRIAPLFAAHLVMKEPPGYTALEKTGLPPALMVILGLESLEQFHQLVSAHERGVLPPLLSWGSCPTLFDSSQAPPGFHTAFLWTKAPYALGGSPEHWKEAKAEFGNAILEHWFEYAPNLRSTIVDSFFLSPEETELALPNMKEGDLLVGSFASGQVRSQRPFAGAGQYRTAVKGLYLCGGCTHPGGNITGLCGYNAARVIAKDCGIKLWWNPPGSN